MKTAVGDTVKICYSGKTWDRAFVGHKIWHVARVKDGMIRVYGLPGYQKSWILMRNAHP